MFYGVTGEMENVITKATEHAGTANDASAASHMLNCVHDCLDEPKTGKVTGIGGVFLKSKGDEKVLADWYQKNLGLHIDQRIGVSILKWSEDKAEDGGITVWDAFPKDTDKLDPSKSDVMINYRVDNITEIYERLKKNDPKSIVDAPKSYENGKFMHALDPEGNKVQLWEPRIWDEKNKEQ